MDLKIIQYVHYKVCLPVLVITNSVSLGSSPLLHNRCRRGWRQNMLPPKPTMASSYCCSHCITRKMYTLQGKCCDLPHKWAHRNPQLADVALIDRGESNGIPLNQRPILQFWARGYWLLWHWQALSTQSLDNRVNTYFGVKPFTYIQ